MRNVSVAYAVSVRMNRVSVYVFATIAVQCLRKDLWKMESIKVGVFVMTWKNKFDV